MADVFTKRKRSEVMSRIRSRGNKDTELALAHILRRNKITGWRRHIAIRGRARSPLRATGGASVPASRLASSLAPPKSGRAVLPRGPNIPAAQQGRPAKPFRVKPDFAFPKLRLAIFVDGCFWHACPIHATKPKNNAAFWREKLAGNRRRDALVTRTLRRAGWRVLRLWEHELARKQEARLLRRIQKQI